MTATTLEPGVYTKNDRVFEVKKSRRYGLLQVKRIEVVGKKVRRRPAGISLRELTPADAIGQDAAASFGKQFGICCMCFRLLSDPTSVSLGIGPVCRKTYFPNLGR
ncbi:DUF6011 domain-containing protein [Streptosporangium sp. OZ121]|uniref:DUF6011 domain-containing protein n=1 Tax=Streptosporangium sp. OZ121 TaxID=3444183 RepID=UPI003F7B1F0F